MTDAADPFDSLSSMLAELLLLLPLRFGIGTGFGLDCLLFATLRFTVSLFTVMRIL